MFKRLRGIAETGHVQGKIPTHHTIALLLVMAGIAIAVPGLRDALLSFLNKMLTLELSLGAPWYIGVIFVLGGTVVYFYGGHHVRRSGELAASAPAGIFVALRHQSFQPLAGRLPDEAVPARFGRRTIRHIEYDLSAFFLRGMMHPVGAVRQQAGLAAELAAIRRAEPDAAVGYYGIVHIPLQFLAGCSVSTWTEVVLFELDRSTNCWRELAEGDGPDLGLIPSL